MGRITSDLMVPELIHRVISTKDTIVNMETHRFEPSGSLKLPELKI
jgi:hypothetical protein